MVAQRGWVVVYLFMKVEIKIKTLSQIQEEQRSWVAHNFPGRHAWHPLLGVQEEVGELSHHFLKRAQNIRLNEDHNEGIKDAVADILIYLLDFCSAEGIDLEHELNKVWEKVRQRDWQANRSLQTD